MPTRPTKDHRDETDVKQQRPRLIIVCGLPGAGKTTLAMKLAPQRQAVRFSADDWMAHLGIDIWDASARERIETLQWRLVEELLVAASANVIIEWGTWSRSERDLLRDRARQLGAAVELHYLDVPFEVLWERIVARGLEDRAGSRAMTRDDLTNYVAVFEAPGEDELALYDEREKHHGSAR